MFANRLAKIIYFMECQVIGIVGGSSPPVIIIP